MKNKGNLTLNDIQEFQKDFCKLRNIENTPLDLLECLEEELYELEEAVYSKNNVEIKSEIADLLIFIATLANCFDISLENAVKSKLKRNIEKYDLELTEKLAKHGYQHSKILSHIKKKWNKAKDSTFF